MYGSGTVDRDSVTVIGKRGPRSGTTLKTQSDVAAAQRKGLAVETEKKYAAGSNSSHQGASNAVKLDNENEELKHEKLDLSVGKIIQKARMDKGLTQVELARLINEKQQVVNEYEQAKGIPNQQIISKLQRALGVKLTGPNKGQPFGAPKAKK